MSVLNASVAIPKFGIDKVMGTVIDTDITTEQFPGVNSYAFPIGIFSNDGGTTWNDCANYTLGTGFTIQPSTSVDITVDSSGILHASNKSGSSSLTYKLALLALETQGTVTPPLFTGNLLYSNKFSYMKIAKEGNYSQTTTSHVTTTIAHNLGYVPFFQVFILDTFYSVDARLRRITANFGNAGSIFEGARADATNIYITPVSYSPAKQVTVYYRIYYET